MSILETESNNTRGTANALPLLTTIDGLLSSASDVDYFALAVGASGVINLVFDRPTIFSGYFTIRLEDVTGSVLASYTDSSDSQSFNIGVTQSAIYYVRIGTNAASAYTSDSYQHSASFTATNNHPAGGSVLVNLSVRH